MEFYTPEEAEKKYPEIVSKLRGKTKHYWRFYDSKDEFGIIIPVPYEVPLEDFQLAGTYVHFEPAFEGTDIYFKGANPNTFEIMDLIESYVDDISAILSSTTRAVGEKLWKLYMRMFTKE